LSEGVEAGEPGHSPTSPVRLGPAEAGRDSPAASPDTPDQGRTADNGEGVPVYEPAEDLPTMPPGPLQRTAALRWATSEPLPTADRSSSSDEVSPAPGALRQGVTPKPVAPLLGDLPPVDGRARYGSASQLPPPAQSPLDPHLQGPPTLRLGPPTAAPIYGGAATVAGATIAGATVAGATVAGAAVAGATVAGAELEGPWPESAGRDGAGPEGTGPEGAGPEGTGPSGQRDALRRDRAGRKRHGKGKTMLALAAVAVVALLAAAVYALENAGTGSHQSNVHHASLGEATFARLLATSASAHDLVAAAVAGSCGNGTPGSASRQTLIGELNRAIGLRVSVLDGTRVDKLSISAIPDGRLLMVELSQATAASLKVDEDYAAWLVDLQATGCFSAPTNDLHYMAATEAAPAAARADQSLAGNWAPLALRVDLRPWSGNQL
jgi:hypothetical protein